MASRPELLEEHRLFGGRQQRWRHESTVLNCPMTFSLFVPDHAAESPPPAVWFLAGLTCTDENFSIKSGAQRTAAELGLMLIMPDTSPRGESVADDDAYDLGQGAGFYLNATQQPWSAHYRMFDYLHDELPALIASHFGLSERQSIMGHSMGGHGALMLALRSGKRFASVSAFAPIVNPSALPWGQKAFRAYLGEDTQRWQEYDSCALLRKASERLPMLIDQGSADPFLDGELQPQRLTAIAEELGYPLTLRMQDGYDHSYFFIATFAEDHLRFHAQHLRG